MNNRLVGFRFAIRIACVACLLAFGFMAEGAPIKTGARAEWLPAKTILMHMPDDEIFLGVVHPAAALFEQPFSLKKAQDEFRNYVAGLEELGIEVIRVEEVLLAGTTNQTGGALPGVELDQLRDFASTVLTYDTSKLPVELQSEQVNYKEQTIAQLSPQELVKIILLRPTIILEQTPNNTEFKASYVEAPLMNLYFCRDQMITTARGIVIANLNSPQRAPETEIMKFVLNKLGIEPIYEVTGEGRLEGGDYFSAGDVAMIGQGLRTNPEGVRQLLDNQVFGVPRVAVVKDSWKNQEEMHLDTYFNIIAPKLAVLVDMRMDLPGRPAVTNFTTLVDVYELQDGAYVKIISDRNFQDYLEDDLGYTVIPASRLDQNLYAINFLTTRANRIMAIDGASQAYKDALKQAGVDATWMDFSALTSGYGAAHCTTQVICREKPEGDVISAPAVVDASQQTTDTVVMISPDEFGFNAETAESNTFQHERAGTKDVHDAAMAEFDAMVKKLESVGVSVIKLPNQPDKHTPDAVFPNNWFSVHKMNDGHRALVLYPMLAPVRRDERQPALLLQELKRSGKGVQEVIDLSPFENEGAFLEGTGSMVLDRPQRVIFAVLSPRTHRSVLEVLASRLGYQLVMFHSVDAAGKPIYHTNVMMGMGKDFCVICLDSIVNSDERQQVVEELQRLGKTIIPISLEQVNNMCGNVIELQRAGGTRILLMSQTAFDHFTAEQKALLESYCMLCPVDIKTIETIGGGSARCMVAEIQ